ncbi:MAG: hypothetical protein AB8D78_10420 [Akkermansiaceae bacterium]
MKKAIWIFPAFLLVACQTESEKPSETEEETMQDSHTEEQTSEEEPSEEPTPEEEEPAAAFDVNKSETLVGQNFEKVKQALDSTEIRYRVVEKDGESFIVTMDFLPDRLNFKIKDGMITTVTKG